MKEFLSIQEVADILGVDYKTIYRLVQQGEIPAGKVGGVYRIPQPEVDAYFERQRQALARQAAQVAQIKCGYCFRLLAPYEVAGSCEAAGCEESICHTCWDADPDHRCRTHLLSRAERLRRAQTRLAQHQIPLLLTSDTAYRRELLYLSRVEAKLREQTEIPHPATGRRIRVADWDAIQVRTQELDRFRKGMLLDGDEVSGGPLPANPRLRYQLGPDFSLEVAVHSDLASHVRQGFVTQPTSQAKLFELLEGAIDGAKRDGILTVLGLAATAGWDQDVVDLIQGRGVGQRPFHHRLVAPVLVDLASDQQLYSHTDGRLDHIAALFSPEMALDLVQDVMAAVEALFRTGRSGVLLSEIVERDRLPEAQVSDAFERLAATGDYRLEEVDKRDRLLLRRSS